MIFTLKFEGKKYVYDTSTGGVVSLPSLPFKMVEALEPPLGPLCPTSLRYELAKYDSIDVSNAYEQILELAEEGVLYGKEDGTIRLMSSGEYAPVKEALTRELLTKAFASCQSPIVFAAIGEKSEEIVLIAKSVAHAMTKEIL